MSIIPNLAHRKQKQLTKADIPDGTIAIGDAAFSLCPLLKQVVIPASVEYIGVAAFCGSGVEVATFLGTPKEIEPSVFAGCKRLTRVVVPKGTRDYFAKFFSISLLQEADTIPQYVAKEPQHDSLPDLTKTPTKPIETDLFGQPIRKSCSLTYNYHEFTWTKGDRVDLNELFSGPTALTGDPSYQFRRKCLFVFMKSATAARITPMAQYSIPANTTHFIRKYKEKYGSRQTRIFLFVCDDGRRATFLDEARLTASSNNTITIRSVL